MKKALALFLACAFGFCVASVLVGKYLMARHSAELAEQQTIWNNDRAALESALQEAQAHPQIVKVPQASAPFSEPAIIPAKPSAEAIITALRAVKFVPGAAQTRAMRRVIHGFEELVAAGPSALPAIRDFLGKNEDVEFNSSTNGKGYRDVPIEFLVPPSLRFGLFDVARQIGGTDAEKILADALNVTTRGTELAWLARALQEMAPEKYHDAALIAAHGMLDRGPDLKAGANDRDQAFKVLTMFNDASYVAMAQAQLIRPDGQVDNAAMKYLLQSLGPQAVQLAAQFYDDPRITDPQKKEPFARVALNYVGTDANANAFYVKAINDFGLSNEQRKNLIEDLNQDGFVDRRNLTAARDLPLIDNRLSIIQQLAPATTDPVNAAALKEAYKDLIKMRERLTAPPKGRLR